MELHDGNRRWDRCPCRFQDHEKPNHFLHATQAVKKTAPSAAPPEPKHLAPQNCNGVGEPRVCTLASTGRWYPSEAFLEVSNRGRAKVFSDLLRPRFVAPSTHGSYSRLGIA